MESSSSKLHCPQTFSSSTSPVPHNNSVASSSSASSSLVTKNPSPLSFVPNTGIDNPIAQPHQVDPQLAPPPPTLISLSNLCKQLPALRISDRVDIESKASGDDLSNASNCKDVGEESRHKFADDSGISSVDSSPYLISSARLRSLDVYIGLPSKKPALLRFTKWLQAELELQGISCFAVDRRKCKDCLEESMADTLMESATFGVVIVTKKSFSNGFSMSELKRFLHKKNLVPIFFELSPPDCQSAFLNGGKMWKSGEGMAEWIQVVNVLSQLDGWKLEAQSSNWRNCIYEAILLLCTRLGKCSAVERLKRWKKKVENEEFPFARNVNFVGRRKELLEVELMLFGDFDHGGKNEFLEMKDLEEKRNPPRDRRSKTKVVVRKQVEYLEEKSINKGKKPVIWKESDEGIEMESSGDFQSYYRVNVGKYERKHIKKKNSTNIIYGRGIACVSGDPGIGKTELLLEFAYRFAQRYRTVLWLGGEARYIRQNYLHLSALLDVDVSIQNQLSLEKDRPRTFEELEEESIRKMKKELTRDIPFLVVIDNLENEKDWWDARNIMELLPRFGGETHILISTSLPRVLNLEPLRLTRLSSSDSIAIMKGKRNNIQPEEIDALRLIEGKVDGLTLGLRIVGGVLSELPISPHGLLEAIEKMPDNDFAGVENDMFRRNHFLIRLIEVCFLVLDQVDEFSSRLALASGWFAPSLIPLSLLTAVSTNAFKTHHGSSFWKKCRGILTCQCLISSRKRSVEESSNILVNLGLARSSMKWGYIQFHDIIKLYARKRGDTIVASAMLHAINSRGSMPEHTEHIWETCFLLFKFGRDPSILHPKVSELVSFIQKFALPLAIYTYSNLSRCNASLELLFLCSNALEAMEDIFLSQMDDEVDKLLCWGSLSTSIGKLSPDLYKELALLKANLLETRGNMMLQGGDFETGRQYCRIATSIREVINGCDHTETLSASNIAYNL